MMCECGAMDRCYCWSDPCICGAAGRCYCGRANMAGEEDTEGEVIRG